MATLNTFYGLTKSSPQVQEVGSVCNLSIIQRDKRRLRELGKVMQGGSLSAPFSCLQLPARNHVQSPLTQHQEGGCVTVTQAAVSSPVLHTRHPEATLVMGALSPC